jgi:hypothetical protein
MNLQYKTIGRRETLSTGSLTLHAKIWIMIRSILLCLILVFASSGLLAADGEDDAPESDIGLAAESAPEKAEGQDHKGAVILKRSYPRRVPERWLGSALNKEVEREFEYAFVYRQSKKASLLTGVKTECDYKLDISDSDVTKREAYCKVEVCL